MQQQNEKMMILKMLETGKITAAEASQLLQSADNPGGLPDGPPPDIPNIAGTASRPAPSPAPAGYGNNGPAGEHRPSARGFDEMAGDLGRKFEAFAKDIEPKIQKFTETVAEKIVSGADKLSKSFSHGTGYSGAPPSPAARPAGSPGGYTEKNIELVVSEGYNELNLSGINGDVRVKGYNGDKITAKVTYKAKRGSSPLELVKLGGKYYLKYEADDFERVSIDAYVPERAFQVVKIDGTNTNMDISSLAANEMLLSNANGNTRLAGLAARNFKADSGNGRFILTGIAAESAAIENVNGTVEAEELDIAHLSLTNYNGPLSLLMSSFNRYNDYVWSVETGNAKLNMNLPTLPDLSYHIKAHAAMSEIRLGLTGLQFLINEPSLVEARSAYFEKAAKKVKLAVETSNAPLTIN